MVYDHVLLLLPYYLADLNQISSRCSDSLEGIPRSILLTVLSLPSQIYLRNKKDIEKED